MPENKACKQKFISIKASEKPNKSNDEHSNSLQGLILSFQNISTLWDKCFDRASIVKQTNWYSILELHEIEKAYDIAASQSGETCQAWIMNKDYSSILFASKIFIKECYSEQDRR